MHPYAIKRFVIYVEVRIKAGISSSLSSWTEKLISNIIRKKECRFSTRQFFQALRMSFKLKVLWTERPEHGLIDLESNRERNEERWDLLRSHEWPYSLLCGRYRNSAVYRALCITLIPYFEVSILRKRQTRKHLFNICSTSYSTMTWKQRGEREHESFKNCLSIYDQHLNETKNSDHFKWSDWLMIA